MKKRVVLLAGLFSMMSPSASSAEEVAALQLRQLLMGFSGYTDVAVTWSVVLVGLAFVVAHRRALDRADHIARDAVSSRDSTMDAAASPQSAGGGGTR